MTRPQPALTPDAHADVLHAVQHYNDQRPLLGFEFLDELEHTTELIRQAPLLSTLVDLFHMAAAYAFHIAENQPFVDGNKRTALNAALGFLDINGWLVVDPDEKLFDAMIAISARTLDKRGLAALLRSLATRENDDARERLPNNLLYHELGGLFRGDRVVGQLPEAAWNLPALRFSPPKTFGPVVSALRVAHAERAQHELVITADGHYGYWRDETYLDSETLLAVSHT